MFCLKSRKWDTERNCYNLLSVNVRTLLRYGFLKIMLKRKGFIIAWVLLKPAESIQLQMDWMRLNLR